MLLGCGEFFQVKLMAQNHTKRASRVSLDLFLMQAHVFSLFQQSQICFSSNNFFPFLSSHRFASPAVTISFPAGTNLLPVQPFFPFQQPKVCFSYIHILFNYFSNHSFTSRATIVFLLMQPFSPFFKNHILSLF